MALKATVNCDMGEGYSLYTMGDDEALMQTIPLANIACGFHASDFMIMDKTDELAACFTYQVGALAGFTAKHGLRMNHLKPHGAIYGQTARDAALARAAVGVAKDFGVAFMGLAGTCHQSTAEEAGVPFIAEWFADLDYSPEGKLLITKKHESYALDEVEKRVTRLLTDHLVTTTGGTLPIGEGVAEVSICCHSDTPDAVKIAQTVKRLVDDSNRTNGYE